MNIEDLTPDEAFIYAVGYDDAHTDLQPQLEELRHVCSNLAGQLAQAIADANYYRTCSTLKPGITRQLEHAITVDHNRRKWRDSYGLNQQKGAA